MRNKIEKYQNTKNKTLRNKP